jgi:hypothetical protein
MDRVEINDAKTSRSGYLPELKPSDTGKTTRKPRIGAAKSKFVIPESFFAPLPDDIVKAFSGR